jgi:hypothetical protein
LRTCQIVPAVSPIWVIHDIEEELGGEASIAICGSPVSVHRPDAAAVKFPVGLASRGRKDL